MEAEELRNMVNIKREKIGEGYWNDYKEKVLNIIKEKVLETYDNPIRLEYEIHLFRKKEMPKTYDWIISETLGNYVSEKLKDMGYKVEIHKYLKPIVYLYADIYWK
jgi:hypothetical protein